MKFQKRFKIANQWVGGENDPCFIIAEAGSNHNRNFETAKKLINVAKDSGADAVKFQTYSAETFYPEEMKPLTLIGETKKPFDVIKEVELPREWQKPLAEYALSQGLIFMSTPFDKEAIDQLDPIVPAFKWGSAELIDRFLLEYVAKKGKPLFISTGYYSMKEIRRSLQWVRKIGNDRVILLQCTSVYPNKPEDVNLRAMVSMKKEFDIPVGFSDHTINTVIPSAAVAMGAKVIEKHFTLSRKMKGPDHNFALEPDELKKMVENIRGVEKALGNKSKKPVPEEVKKEKLIRRGVISKRDIKKGERFSLDNVFTKRTGRGSLNAAEFFKIIGKRAKRDISMDRMVNLDDAE